MAYTTIDDGSEYFHTQLYTGTGSELSVTNGANAGDFKPDWIWIKQRNAGSTDHGMFDSSRGVTKNIKTNVTDAQSTEAQSVKTFNTDGFTLGTSGDYNGSSDTHAAWQWKANGGTRTTNTESGNNPAGGFQANTTAGFSIVDYTGTGSAGTMAHGLGAVPHMILFKARSEADNDWAVYHQGNTSAPETDFLRLNTTGVTTDNANFMNDTAPTSSVFTVGTGSKVNSDGETYIAYCFTEKQGYSKFGGYTANNNANGPFIYLGFKPKYLVIKKTSAAGEWHIFDTTREPTGNPIDQDLYASGNYAEGSDASFVDFLSNGFKLRANHTSINGEDTSQTYIYMAFGETFVSSKGVPTTAR